MGPDWAWRSQQGRARSGQEEETESLCICPRGECSIRRMRVSRDWTEVQKCSQHFKQRFSLRTHDWDLLHYWQPLELLGWSLCWELSAKVKDLNEKSRRIITKLIGERMVEWAKKYTPSLNFFYFSYYKIYFCCWNFTWKLALHSKEYKYSNFALFIL